MGVNSLPKTVTRQRRDCDFNPGPTAPESSTLTTRLPSHPSLSYLLTNLAGRRLAYRRTLHYQFIIVSCGAVIAVCMHTHELLIAKLADQLAASDPPRGSRRLDGGRNSRFPL